VFGPFIYILFVFFGEPSSALILVYPIHEKYIPRYKFRHHNIKTYWTVDSRRGIHHTMKGSTKSSLSAQLPKISSEENQVDTIPTNSRDQEDESNSQAEYAVDDNILMSMWKKKAAARATAAAAAAVATTATSSLQIESLNPHPENSAATAKEKAKNCVHGKVTKRCKDCTPTICIHNKPSKRFCPECGGSGLCHHGRDKRRCKDCGGSSICQHKREKYKCRGALS
jgi:hypothetical protein